MFVVTTADDIAALRETVDLECKLAAGQDGKGKLPDDLWETYSAFANTQGGTILLGLREKSGTFSINGIDNTERIIKDLFNNLSNRQKVSTNLLSDDHVQVINVDGKDIIQINVPRASRRQRPVFLNGNPLNNTYKRLQEGDRRCDDETVKRMLAEQVEDSRDTHILNKYGYNDIAWESFRIYRQALRDNKPDHPWLELDDWDLLNKLNGWRTDRETDETGLTLAGLLMFGRWESIQEFLPNYFVDYQEQSNSSVEQRWTDRIVPDGTWSGNLYDFYRRVYRKLVVDLKVPFALEAGVRRDETPIHKAVREALVNTLVHADYSGRSSVLIVRRPDMFTFRNPGNMRIPVGQALQGGESDCRNRTLHQMFLMIGIGERAGSGIPTIINGWKKGNWRPPVLAEKEEPERTVLELRMLDLLPKHILSFLQKYFDSEFPSLSDLQRLILATALIEGTVSHARIKEITVVHPADLSKALQELVRKSCLESTGRGRSTQYHLQGFTFPSPEDVFSTADEDMIRSVNLSGISKLSADSSEHSASSSEHSASSSERSADSSEHSASSSEHSADSSEHSASSSEHSADSSEPIENDKQELDLQGRDESGRLISDYIDAPIVDRLDNLSHSFLVALQDIAIEPRQKPYLKKYRMREVLLALCNDQYITLQALSQLVSRNPDRLRQEHLSSMVKEGLLWLAFPQTPTHEKQAYQTAKS